MLGTLCALGILRGRFPGRDGLLVFVLSPMMLPGVVLGIAMLVAFRGIGLVDGYRSLILAHVVITLPYVVRVLYAAFVLFDFTMIDAARTLGFSHARALWQVLVPNVLPSFATAAMFAFLASVDNYALALFLGDVRNITLPIQILNYLDRASDPSVAAIATLMVLFTALDTARCGAAGGSAPAGRSADRESKPFREKRSFAMHLRWLLLFVALGISAPLFSATRIRRPIPAGRCAWWCRLRRAAAPTCSRASSDRSSAAMWPNAVTVDNRPGASATIGTEIVARSKPDGLTMLLIADTHAINVSLYKKLPYDPVKDFSPVILLATAPHIVVVHPSVPANSLQELIDHAKSRPGALNYSSSGPAGTSYVPDGDPALGHRHEPGSRPLQGRGSGDDRSRRGRDAGHHSAGGNDPGSVAQRQGAAARRAEPAALAASARDPDARGERLSGIVYESWYGVLAPAGTPADDRGRR